MAKKHVTAKKAGSQPYLCMAILCEQVLIDKDGVLSAVRIVDKVLIKPVVSSTIPGLPKPAVILTGLVGFRSGGFRGNKTVRVVARSPDGKVLIDTAVPAKFQGKKNETFILRANMALEVEKQGLYYIDAFLDGKLVNRIPLEVEHLEADVTTGSVSLIASPHEKKPQKAP
jgi:hypothetical protein